MRRMLVVAVALGVGCATWGVTAQELSHVFVEVLDRAGQPVSGLTPADFSLLEDDVDLEVVSVERGAAQPMRVALLVDNGGRIAVAGERDALQAGLMAFLRTLAPRHEVSLYTIRGQIRRRAGFTTDRGALGEAVSRMRAQPYPRVALLDSVRETARRRFDDDEPFPVIVLVLTNGDENHGRAGHESDFLVAELARAGITVHAVVLQSGSGRSRAVDDPRAVPPVAHKLTEFLGGAYETLTSRTELTLALARLASRMTASYERVSARYRVGYVRSGPEERQIMVGVNRPDANVRLFQDLRLY